MQMIVLARFGKLLAGKVIDGVAKDFFVPETYTAGALWSGGLPMPLWQPPSNDVLWEPEPEAA